MLAVVDSGPLYAVTDTDDDDYERSLAVLQRADLQLVIPALVVAEVTNMIGRRLGPRAEAQFLCGLTQLEVEPPVAEDWPRIAELVERYEDFQLGGTDASVVALAERLGTDLIITSTDTTSPRCSRATVRPFRSSPRERRSADAAQTHWTITSLGDNERWIDKAVHNRPFASGPRNKKPWLSRARTQPASGQRFSAFFQPEMLS